MLTATGVAWPVNAETQGIENTAVHTPSVLHIRGGNHKGYNRLVFEWERPTPWHLDQDGTVITLHFGRAGQAVIAPSGQHLDHIKHIETSTGKDGNLRVSLTLDYGMAVHAFEQGTHLIFDVSAIKGTADQSGMREAGAETPEKPAEVLVAEARPAPVPEPAPVQPVQTQEVIAPPPSPAPLPAANAAPPPNLIDLPDKPSVFATVDTQSQSALAVFIRGDYAYIVFDQKIGIPLDQLNGAFAPNILKLEEIDAAQTSVYRFVMPKDADLRIGRNGTAWRFLLSKKSESFPLGLPIIPDPGFSLGGRLVVSVANPGQPVAFTDPVVGDTLIVIPTQRPTEAVTVARHYVDLDFLPALQGVVIAPHSSDVKARDITDGVELSMPGGLRLSALKASGDADSDMRNGSRIFDLDRWRADTDSASFTAVRQRLQLNVVNAPVSEKDRARLDLARFYFSNGYGYEAVALLDLIGQAVPDLAARPEFLVLHGAAQILADHVQNGMDDIAKSNLGDTGEGKLWRAVGFAKLRDWPHAAELFSATRPLLENYPDPFFQKFALLATDSWISMGDYGNASGMLDSIIARSNGDGLHNPKVLYLRGVVQSHNGNLDDAEKSWHEAAASNDRLPRTRAELALADLDLTRKKITVNEAAERLERLRFAWRGDSLEFDILHRLGLFQFQAGRYGDALATLREAVRLYPNDPGVPEVSARMRQIFHDLFLTDLGKSLSPLASLTLYQQYKDLTPTNAEAQQLALKIAEKLIDIDLLNQACDVIQSEMDKTPPGVDKAQVGSQLAAIYLLNHQPDKAVTALDQSEISGLPAKLIEDRRLLRARALSDQGKQADALAVVADDSSEAALRLKVDISWRQKDWKLAAQYLGQLVGAPPPAGQMLPPDRAQIVLNRAVAFALAHDAGGLDEMGRQFGDSMKGTANASAFELLTQPDKLNGPLDMTDVQSQMANVDLFRSFLDGYRKVDPGADATAAPAEAEAPASPPAAAP